MRAPSLFGKGRRPHHPDVAQSLNNLALLYMAQGRYAEAEPLYKRALAILQKALGPEHPANATSLNNLALLYHAQGRYSEAEPLYQAFPVWLGASPGTGTPHIGDGLHELGRPLRRTRSRPGRRSHFTDAPSPFGRRLSARHHPDVVVSLQKLASLYQAQGRHAEAGTLIKQALTILETAFGPEHPDLATFIENYATSSRKAGREDKPETMETGAAVIPARAR